jgi:anti-sigma regulatory factor (Ser/Thr protein kinase)
MLEKIRDFVSQNPGLKARTIASRLGFERSPVSALLHAHKDTFQQDVSSCWSLVPPAELRVEFSGKSWLTAKDVEKLLSKAGSPLDSPCQRVVFSLKEGSRMMLESLARLLALSNQLAHAGKTVVLDFAESRSTATYLDRLGFFDHLSDAIQVLPKQPKRGLSKQYRGNNYGVIEFRAIDPAREEGEIPRLLERSFVSCAGENYSVAVMTILSELYSNVLEHSGASTLGFAGLQSYKATHRIQAVISDNGLGIVGTLGPVLEQRYPKVAQKIANSKDHAGVALLKEVFSAGQISQVDAEGRGLGLKQSREFAKKFRARISVRQRDFELRIHHSNDRVTFTQDTNLVRIEGTHICFDFMLDSPDSAL